jgi:hypothetical protein
MSPCPDLETLFAELAEGAGPALEHSKSCPACAAVLEEHRQLEKDLFRLQDPLPPPGFVPMVMQRVATAPAPMAVELRTGLTILGLTAALFVTFFVARGGSVGDVGSLLARTLVQGRLLLVGLVEGFAAVWKTAGVPVAATAAVLLVLSLLGLRKLAGADLSVKV